MRHDLTSRLVTFRHATRDRNGRVPGDIERTGVDEHLQRPRHVLLATRIRGGNLCRFEGYVGITKRSKSRNAVLYAAASKRPKFCGFRIVSPVVALLHIDTQHGEQLDRL